MTKQRVFANLHTMISSVLQSTNAKSSVKTGSSNSPLPPEVARLRFERQQLQDVLAKTETELFSLEEERDHAQSELKVLSEEVRGRFKRKGNGKAKEKKKGKGK